MQQFICFIYKLYMLTYFKYYFNRWGYCRCKICITVLSDICLSDILLHFTTGRAIFDKFSISQCSRIEKRRVDQSLMNFVFSETSVCFCQEIQNEFSCRFKNFRPSFTLLTVIFVQFFLFSLKNSVLSRFLNGFLKIFYNQIVTSAALWMLWVKASSKSLFISIISSSCIFAQNWLWISSKRKLLHQIFIYLWWN